MLEKGFQTLVEKRVRVGRKKSKRGEKPLKTFQSSRNTNLHEMLAKVFEQFQGNLNGKRCRDFVFHMTDWESDLFELAQVYKHPNPWDRVLGHKIGGILGHVIPHMAQAAFLL